MYLIILRLLHILCGVFWAGTAMFMAFYVSEAVKRLGPDGGKVMQTLAGTRNFSLVLTLTSVTTLLSGYLLLWELSSGFTPSWFTSRYATSLTLGGVIATLAFLIGLMVSRPAVTKTQKIGAQIAARKTPPTPEELAELTRLRNRMFGAANAIAIGLLLSVVFMAVARYL